MNRILWISALAVLVLAGPLVAQEGMGPDPDRRRQHLEARVRGQFMAQVAERLELTAGQRQAMEAVLREGVEARRSLFDESRSLHGDLIAAMEDQDTPMAEFQTILDRFERVREQERAIAVREDERLAEILNPRQQALFLFLRMQFNQRIRGMRGPGPMGGGPPGGPPGGPTGGPTGGPRGGPPGGGPLIP